MLWKGSTQKYETLWRGIWSSEVKGGDVVRELSRGREVEAEMWSVNEKWMEGWGRKNVSTEGTVYAKALRTGNIAFWKKHSILKGDVYSWYRDHREKEIEALVTYKNDFLWLRSVFKSTVVHGGVGDHILLSPYPVWTPVVLYSLIHLYFFPEDITIFRV